MKLLNFYVPDSVAERVLVRTLAVHHPVEGGRPSLPIRLGFKNSDFPSAAIEGIAAWQAGLPVELFFGPEDTLVKTCRTRLDDAHAK